MLNPLINRDIVNAELLKKTLHARAISRRHEPGAIVWMQKQFHRWLIATFEHTSPLSDLAAFEDFTGIPAPEWLCKKIEMPGKQSLEFIDPDHPYLLQLEARCAEWLAANSNTYYAKKFHRMTPPQVLRNWRADHQRMARHKDTSLKNTTGNAIKPILRCDGFNVVEFDASQSEFRAELFNESVQMGHCLGQFSDSINLSGGYGEHYAENVENSTMRLYSVRGANGRSHVTIAIAKRYDEEWIIKEIKGRQNKPPVEKYVTPVKALLRRLTIFAIPHPDCTAINLFVQDGSYVSLNEVVDENVKLFAIMMNPGLIAQIDKQTTAFKWLVACNSPDNIKLVNRPDPLMEVVAVLLDPFIADQLEPEKTAAHQAANGRAQGVIDNIPFKLNRLYNWCKFSAVKKS